MKRELRVSASLAAIVCAIWTPVQAAAATNAEEAGASQVAQGQGTSDQNKKSATDLDVIVVTGSSSNLRVLETSYDVTVLDEGEIRRDNPVGLTDLIDAVPGLQGEYANGEVNSNLNVRGTQAGFMSFISLQEDGLPVQYSPFFSEYELRYDATYGRVETVLGGPSGIFTAQGAAATINFISRRPTSTEGEMNVSLTSYGQARTDLFYGGPIGNDGWWGTVGGFFRHGPGVRSLGFTAANGGQLRAAVGKEFERGEVSLAYKRIDDRTDYTNPLPVDVSGKYPTAFPGFDALHDTLVGPDVRYIDAIDGGGIQRRDLAEGQRSKTDQFTLAADYQLTDNLTVSLKSRYNHIRTNSYDLRGGPNSTLYDAPTFVAAQLPALQAAFPTATSVGLVRVNDGMAIADPATLNGNGLLTTHDTIRYDRDQRNFINDLQLTYDSEVVTLTAGLQYWDVATTSSDVQDVFLMDVRNHSNRMDVAAYDAGGNVVGHLTRNGVLTYGSLDNYGGLDINSVNPYFNVELRPTSNLNIDAGVRYEMVNMDGWGEDVSFGVPIPAAYDDPLVLADNARAITRNGDIYRGEVDIDAVTWTVGANYQFTDSLAIYGRYASAHDMGYLNEFTFFNIPAFGAPAGSNLFMASDPTRLKFSEFGIRYLGSVVSGSVTAFHTKHLNSGAIIVSQNNANVVIPVDTIAKGAEFQFDIRPTDALNLAVSGLVMDAKRSGSGFDGPVDRLPETQLRFAPSWEIGKVTVFGSAQYYSKRYQDRATTRLLPAYTLFDLGVSYEPIDGLLVTLQANNLLDKMAFTSGNFREGFTQGPNPYGYASVIPGRTGRLTVGYSF
ncbi:MAG: TonB-dependent receptor [Parvularculaceae bacterium]|nr:TonB-dependent receptor [Parvularculaceae bacterium]